jgi:hypothetical protein
MRYVEATLLVTEGRLDEASAVLGSATENSTTIADHLRAWIARWSRNAELLEQAVDSFGHNPDDVFGSGIWRARVLWSDGRKAELSSLLDEMGPQLRKQLETSPDQALPLSILMELYAMHGDRSGFDDMLYRYDHNLKPDALRLSEQAWVIPIAFAILGDAEAAMDRIEPVIEQFGVWDFYRFSMDPAFDSMRDNPRYKVLDRRYQQWLESRKQ